MGVLSITTSMIKNVIFDLGGVLIRFQPKEAIHQLGLSKEKEDALYSAIFLDPLWLEVDKGVYQGVSETLDLYLEKYPSLQKEIKMFFHPGWEDMFEILDEGRQFLLDLKEKGYHCYILSNYGVEAFAYTEKRYKEVFGLFDGKVISGRLQMIKPEERIFQYLIDTYDLKKEECVFFDDTKENVDASNTFGIHAFVYQNAKDAMHAMQSLDAEK